MNTAGALVTAATPRVPLLDAASAPLTARRYFSDGDPGPIVAALASVPELLEVTLPFLSTVLSASALDARTKEIVIVRTSAVQECRYCIDAHSVVALDTGLTVAEVRTLSERSPASLPDEREAALLAWIDAVAGATGPVQDSVAARLGASYRDYEIVELTLLIGATMMLNRFCTALSLPTSTEVTMRLTEEGLV
ncbi:MAG: carboxymuconolactone decarboxylase family protein [Geodermatophilaceae bacterium]|nr:carboxymuconolactone decarboxylase family protein [Geodermatophilaceae bacterium]